MLFWSLFAALTAFNVAAVWVSDILPVLDAASHLHLISIIHHFEDTPVYQHHYAEVDAIVPYLTYYKAVDWLALLVGIEAANRVVLSLCLIALPWSALHLLRALRHNRWLVLGIFPWALNADFFMGFFNYLMSIPIFLWILAAHLRFLRRPHWKNAALVMGLIMALAITHYLLWAVTLCLLPLMALVMGWRSGRWLRWPLREVGLCLPSILTLLPWFLSYFVLAEQARTADQAAIGGATLLSRLKQLYAGNHLTPLANIDQVFDRMFNQFMFGSQEVVGLIDFLLHRPGEVVSAMWLLGLALWLLGAIRRQVPVKAAPPAARPPVIDGSAYAAWALSLVALAYFSLPQHLSRPIILYGVNFRLVEVLAILAVVALPLRPLAPMAGVRLRVWAGSVLMLVAAVLMPLQTAGAFMMVRTELGSIRQAFAAIPANHSVLTLRARRGSRYLKEQVFSGLGEYYAVFQGGYVPYSFADSSSKPVIARAERALPGPIWYDHNTFDMKHHGRYFDYIVVYRALDERPGRWEHAMTKWPVVYARDRWRVFKNPDKARWPPPTPAELAHEARVGRAVSLAMACIGLPGDPEFRASPEVLLDVLGVPKAARVR